MPSTDPAGDRELDDAVRRTILAHFTEDARAPDPAELSRRVGATRLEVDVSLRRINHPQSIVLAPGSDRVWMAHPFSAVPTEIEVLVGGQRYWVCCASESLGLPFLLDTDIRIRTRCGDCAAPMRIEVGRGGWAGRGVIHFLVPPVRALENIGFACATTLFFRSAEHVRRWCDERGLEPGTIVPLTKAYELARRGAQARRARGFRSMSLAERFELYRSADMAHAFWPTPPPRHGGLIAGDRALRSGGGGPSAGEGEPVSVLHRLTRRELEVLNLMIEARRQKQIARDLGISPHTVDSHIRKIYAKLGVRSRAGAISVALRESGLRHGVFS